MSKILKAELEVSTEKAKQKILDLYSDFGDMSKASQDLGKVLGESIAKGVNKANVSTGVFKNSLKDISSSLSLLKITANDIKVNPKANSLSLDELKNKTLALSKLASNLAFKPNVNLDEVSKLQAKIQAFNTELNKTGKNQAFNELSASTGVFKNSLKDIQGSISTLKNGYSDIKITPKVDTSNLIKIKTESENRLPA